MEKPYINDKCISSFFVGEIGWGLSRWFGYLRWLKHEIYKDHEFLIVMNPNLHVFVDDFIKYTVDLPDEFYNLKLDQDCYEAVLPNSSPGSLTPPDVYSNLIEYMRNFYNNDSAIEILSPRGANFWVDSQKQMFRKITSGDPIKSDRPIVVVFPRARVRAAQRNVPAFVWYDIVMNLVKDFTVILAGTPSGACLGDLGGDNIVNLISYNEEDKTDKIIQYLNSAVCSISSQSGGTHISLQSGCPSYIIGHEKERHCIKENYLGTPTSFRYVTDYRAIDSQTILEDIASFLDALQKASYINEDNIIKEDSQKLNKLIEENL